MKIGINREFQNTCLKTQKLQSVCKLRGELCKTGVPLLCHFPKLFKTISK